MTTIREKLQQTGKPFGWTPDGMVSDDDERSVYHHADDVVDFATACVAEALQPKEMSAELAEAEARLRREATTGHDCVERAQCAIIAAEIDRLRAALAKAEAARARPSTNEIKTPREFFGLSATGELASNFSERDMISYATACVEASMQVGRSLLSMVESELIVEKEENAKELATTRAEAFAIAKRAADEIAQLRAEVDRLKLEAAEAVSQPAPSSEQPSLDCDHCGCVAIESFTGIFYSGDGGHCRTCGFPGSVSCDSENPPYWSVSDEDDATCADPDCDDCSERDAGRVVGERPFVRAAAQTAEGVK